MQISLSNYIYIILNSNELQSIVIKIKKREFSRTTKSKFVYQSVKTKSLNVKHECFGDIIILKKGTTCS